MMHRRVITADLALIGAALALSLFGIAMVYSAGQTDVPTVATRAWVSQIKWLLVALVAAFLVSRASVRLIEWLTWPAFLLTYMTVLAWIASFAIYQGGRLLGFG